MENPRIIIPEMDLSSIIAESRDVAKALNAFADDLERIEKKYAKLRRNDKSHCDHYKKESEVENGHDK